MWGRSIPFALALLGCGHAYPTVQARLDVAGPALEGDALGPARERLHDVPAGARAWHDLQARRRGLLEAVERAYRNAGYPDARAGGFAVELAPDRNAIRVGVRVAAGPRARLGVARITYAAPRAPGPRAPAELGELPADTWYSEDRVQEAVQRLEQFFGERGYPRVVVAARRTVNEGRVDVELLVERGPRFTIDSVELVVAPGRRARRLSPSRVGLEAGALFRRDAVEAALSRIRDQHAGREAHWRLVPQAERPTRATLRFSVE